MAMQRDKQRVPFPQFDKPGSKISPFTGKPYTRSEANRVHNQTLAKNKSKSKISQNAIERRLGRENASRGQSPHQKWNDGDARTRNLAPDNGKSPWQNAAPALKKNLGILKQDFKKDLVKVKSAVSNADGSRWTGNGGGNERSAAVNKGQQGDRMKALSEAQTKRKQQKFNQTRNA